MMTHVTRHPMMTHVSQSCSVWEATAQACEILGGRDASWRLNATPRMPFGSTLWSAHKISKDVHHLEPPFSALELEGWAPHSYGMTAGMGRAN